MSLPLSSRQAVFRYSFLDSRWHQLVPGVFLRTLKLQEQEQPRYFHPLLQSLRPLLYSLRPSCSPMALQERQQLQQPSRLSPVTFRRFLGRWLFNRSEQSHQTADPDFSQFRICHGLLNQTSIGHPATFIRGTPGRPDVMPPPSRTKSSTGFQAVTFAT